ncbi:MAG TPA: ornithine decarboxylase [Actinocrinis sp.]|jgi:ornithine decarboxylase
MNPYMRAALESADEDRIVLDLGGIAQQYVSLLRELPGVAVRYAMKAGPVDEVLGLLAAMGAGVDAAGPREVEQAVRAGVPVGRIHYGNTVKSDRSIAEAYRLGVRDFATDSRQDVAALAAHAPGARVFCRLATNGEGAVWRLSRKFGCSGADAVRVMAAARNAGLVPAGLSVHVGSQQMDPEAWQNAFDAIADVLAELGALGIAPGHVNLGGGLPAPGYLDRRGVPLEPPLDKIFAVIREGVQRLRETARSELDFLVEPGRHLIAPHGAIRAHVARLSSREQPTGEQEHWLYLSCGKFNGLYEMDQLRYRLVFPGHPDQDADSVPAVVAGPTCDSDDAYAHDHEHPLVRVPRTLSSGDPVWILSCGAYSISYMTTGFNGISPLPYQCIRGGPVLTEGLE